MAPPLVSQGLRRSEPRSTEVLVALEMTPLLGPQVLVLKLVAEVAEVAVLPRRMEALAVLEVC